jgi:hypothetical protein
MMMISPVVPLAEADLAAEYVALRWLLSLAAPRMK